MQESVRDIRASDTTWWWWYIYIYIYTYAYVYLIIIDFVCSWQINQHSYQWISLLFISSLEFYIQQFFLSRVYWNICNYVRFYRNCNYLRGTQPSCELLPFTIIVLLIDFCSQLKDAGMKCLKSELTVKLHSDLYNSFKKSRKRIKFLIKQTKINIYSKYSWYIWQIQCKYFLPDTSVLLLVVSHKNMA